MPFTTPTPDRPYKGGPDFHKPGCGCNACVARRRKAEALAQRAGQPEQPNPDLPAKQTQETVLTDLVYDGRNVQRARVKKWLGWKALEPKLTQEEAAKRMGIAKQTLTNTIYKATKEGWLKFEDPLDELEYEIIPKVTQNLKHFLDQGDKDVTIKTAQGTLFKQYQESKGITETAKPTTVLAFKIEVPPGGPTYTAGHIVGTPRTLQVEPVSPASQPEIIDVEPITKPSE